jgi:hypothetical protein
MVTGLIMPAGQVISGCAAMCIVLGDSYRITLEGTVMKYCSNKYFTLFIRSV